jgi:hypothetical protein
MRPGHQAEDASVFLVGALLSGRQCRPPPLPDALWVSERTAPVLSMFIGGSKFPHAALPISTSQ